MDYDIFNGDADGIFALQQYRLENPAPGAQLLTGVKRDIRLLSQVEYLCNSSLTVFDISLDSNRIPLVRLLGNNNRVVYFDHHFAGTLPQSPLLQTFIDHSPDTCTSLLVDATLAGKHCLWAICGAFGDNLHQQARDYADDQGLTRQQTGQLQELGELFNYNGYGTTLEDLHFHPAELFKAVQPYRSPFDFIAQSTELAILRSGYRDDLAAVMQVPEMQTPGKNRVYLLPSTPWARRVTGVFSNLRAREMTHAAHAVLSENDDSSLRISVRAPLDDRQGADTLCKLFPTGGGRAAAAGINSLPADQLDKFLEKFLSFYR
ncbi:acetyltransferase [Desulfocastanea catecholica]